MRPPTSCLFLLPLPNVFVAYRNTRGIRKRGKRREMKGEEIVNKGERHAKFQRKIGIPDIGLREFTSYVNDAS